MHLEVKIRDKVKPLEHLLLVPHPLLLLQDCHPVENDDQQIWILLHNSLLHDPPSVAVFALGFGPLFEKVVDRLEHILVEPGHLDRQQQGRVSELVLLVQFGLEFFCCETLFASINGRN